MPTTQIVTFDANGESPAFDSPHFARPVFFRRNPLGGEGYYLAYASDGSPTNGNQYETFATAAEVEAFAARRRFVPARD